MHRPQRPPTSNSQPSPWGSPRRSRTTCASHLVSTHKLHRCVHHKLTRHTSRTRVRGDTRGGPEADRRRHQAYHGRRGATRGKDANSVTWYSGTTAPGDPMPPHWADATPTLVTGSIATSAKGVQATRATMVTKHTRLTIVTDTGPPIDAALCVSVPPTIFPIRTLRLSTRTFLPADATQSSSSAETTSRTAETEISKVRRFFGPQDHQQRNGASTGNRSTPPLLGQHGFSER